MSGLSEQFKDSILKDTEVDYVEGSFTKYKNREISPNWLLQWYEYIKELEDEGPARFAMTPRGIGYCGLTCAYCGVQSNNDMASFISRDDRDAVEALFKEAGMTLHFRGDFSDWPQVKLGACDRHLPNLRSLYNALSGSVYGRPGTVTLKKLEDSKKHESV